VQRVREDVVAVVGDDDGAVHVPAAQVTQRASRDVLRTRHHEDELEVGIAQRGIQPVDRAREEWVAQDALVRFGHHERHRVGAPRDERARRTVGDVPEVGDRCVNRRLRLRGTRAGRR